MSRSTAPARFAAIATSVVALVVGTAPLASAATGPDPSGFTLAAQQPTLASQFTVAKSVTGRLAKSDPALLKRTDSAPVSVMVKLDLDSVASYAGGVEGLAPTSPVATGKSLQRNATAVKAYTRHANKVVGDAAGDIKRAVPAAKVGKSFTSAYGGLAVKVPANKAKDLLSIPGVVAVQSDTLQHTLTDPPAVRRGHQGVAVSRRVAQGRPGRHRRRARQRRLARAPVVRGPRHPHTGGRAVRLRVR